MGGATLFTTPWYSAIALLGLELTPGGGWR
jgi:hypothetical protein